MLKFDQLHKERKKGLVSTGQGFELRPPDSKTAMLTVKPQPIAYQSCGIERTDFTICQISTLWKVRTTSTELGTI